jgi:hypothetical protein
MKSVIEFVYGPHKGLTITHRVLHDYILVPIVDPIQRCEKAIRPSARSALYRLEPVVTSDGKLLGYHAVFRRIE